MRPCGDHTIEIPRWHERCKVAVARCVYPAPKELRAGWPGTVVRLGRVGRPSRHWRADIPARLSWPKFVRHPFEKEIMSEKFGQYRGESFCLEMLEERRLLSGGWAPTARVDDQDLAIRAFKKITGRGQSVAILDTGVDYNHPALGGGWGRTVIGGYDFVDNDSDPMDQNGHGTEVAGMIAARQFTYGGYKYRGIAPGVKIVALRIEDNSDYLPDSRVEAALRWVINNRKKYNITAVNMSFGDGDYQKKFTRAPYG